jgi:hypothetical protein
MNDPRLIYPNDHGGIAVAVPSAEALATHTPDQLAQRLVPPGRPWKWISADDLPGSRMFRDAWEWSND